MKNMLINPKTGKEYEDVPSAVAAEYLGVAVTYIRQGLQQGRLPFGTAVQGAGGRWSYNIPINRLKVYKNGFDNENIQKLIQLLLGNGIAVDCKGA